jgi:phosphoribosylamine-glycine ligase
MEGKKVLDYGGGRVLGVTAYSPEGIAEAKEIAYKGSEVVTIPDGFYFRTDIADKALKREG